MRRRKQAQDQANAESAWESHDVPAQGLSLLASTTRGLVCRARTRRPCLAHLVPFSEHAVPRAALVLSPVSDGLRLNGCSPPAVAVLEDRDELARAGEQIYFGASSAVAPFRLASADLGGEACARCKEPLQVGDEVVRCGHCRTLHHEGRLASRPEERRNCWSYDLNCARCLRPRAALDGLPEGGGHG